MKKTALAALSLSALAAYAIPVSFEMPYDGKATVVIDDASGVRVRNLVNGIPFKKGRHAVEWDGRAEDGSGAEPGECRIRVVTHPGLSYDYKGPFAAGGENLFQGFGPSHTACTMSMARGDRVVVASLFPEGGYSTLVLDLDGRLVRGYSDGWNLGNKVCFYLPGTGDFFLHAPGEGRQRTPVHGLRLERNSPPERPPRRCAEDRIEGRGTNRRQSLRRERAFKDA